MSALDYDWTEVWGYADGKNMQSQTPDIQSVDDALTTPFEHADLAEEMGRSEGENDERDWIVWGRLNDGRYFPDRRWLRLHRLGLPGGRLVSRCADP